MKVGGKDPKNVWLNNLVKGGKPIRKTEVEVRVGKLKKGKATGKDDVTGDMVKGGGDMVVDWVWRICNMTFESVVVPET